MRRRAADLAALTVLLGLVGLVGWNRSIFDSWLLRYDIYTQFLPWYHYLGERLAAGEIPAWNPHQLAGTPFAGHPLSGWMYLPAMIAFAVFPVLVGFKAMVAFHLGLAAISTYLFARVLGMIPLSSLTAALVFTFGPFLEWNTYTSLQFAQFAAWVPLTLLGVEVSVRASAWRHRVAPWVLAAAGCSQMLAGWVGEGWIYTMLLVGTYIGYRTTLSGAPTRTTFGARVRLTLGLGLAVLGGGVLLGAANILPRLATNAQTSLAGGAYGDLGAQGVLNPPWSVDYLVTQLLGLGSGYHFRAAGLGGAVIVLLLLGVILARKKFAVPYFAGLTTVALVLTLEPTPLHHLLYLLPRYQELHEHDPWRVVALASIGPAMLSGAGIEMVRRHRGHYRLLPVVMLPLVLIAGGALAVGGIAERWGWAPLLGATVVTAVALVVIDLPPDREMRPRWRWLPTGLLALMSAVVFLLPTGLELTGSWLGWPPDPRWAARWTPNPAHRAALDTQVSVSDPGGAGEVLQAEMAASGPFRYMGYGGIGHPDGGAHARSYMDRRFDPHLLAILMNGRAMFLGLDEIQGYDPIQLERYVAFIRAINGKGQDYHTAFVSDEGVDSPLLDLLNVRYLLIDASLPQDRADVVVLTDGFKEVIRTDQVVVYERTRELPHAWIVQEVRQVAHGEALPQLVAGDVDPYRTALVEEPVRPLEATGSTANGRAAVTAYGSEAITIATETETPGWLIVSEMYADGWHATVNGAPVAIVATHHALHGVPVPAGKAIVELRYHPAALQLGLWVSVGTAALMAAAIVATGWRNRTDRRLTKDRAMVGMPAWLEPSGPHYAPYHAPDAGIARSTDARAEGTDCACGHGAGHRPARRHEP